MEWLTLSQTGFQGAARYLLGMRLAIVTIMLLAIAVTDTFITLSHRAEALLLCLAYGVLATLAWLWFTRRPPQSILPVTMTLGLDLLLIGCWLYNTGGYTNPLVSLLLLPLAIALVLVPLNHAIGLTIGSVLIYTLLMLWHQPISSDAISDTIFATRSGAVSGMAHNHGANLAQLHLIGMWVTFVLTAVILVLAVGTLAHQLRGQQLRLSQSRETRLRDEQIISLGLSSAAIAHRLGTPMNTLTLLVEELKTLPPDADIRADLELMSSQLALCGQHLQQLSASAMQAKLSQLETLSLEQWLQRLQESTTLLWPEANIHWQRPFPPRNVQVDATLDQAVLNLLANAITASPQWVAVSAQAPDANCIEIIVEDQGDGLASALLDSPGSCIVNSETGMGVGLFLSNATIGRLGGKLKARSNSTDGRGTTMIIELPTAEYSL
ncbi:sensor histidine kinase [Marinobacter sp. ELB17]|uniref:sensor histidine kinase n=1 Tax=Marinobacter sp. ELB17 TaxID=270374 RepID=UPI0000F37483|nr:HAMP domain-containing sensor histidine kinase [Marinobacter sp. ELB17]EBA00609.1 Signal transduction histidine kinase [Marinobacter sp. ELB17]